MKKVLSMVLVLCILSTMLAFNVSASVPTDTKANWVKLLSEDFEGTQEYFTTK